MSLLTIVAMSMPFYALGRYGGWAAGHEYGFDDGEDAGYVLGYTEGYARAVEVAKGYGLAVGEMRAEIVYPKAVEK